MSFPLILIFSFSIFSMFFGSGNLVFPLKVGVASGHMWTYGLAGLLLSGILLPFLGLMGVKLKQGSVESFFKDLGPGLKVVVPFFLISLLGSFGVVPRCITVAHGGLEKIFPSLSLGVFSALFCFISFALCYKPGRLIPVLGRYLTPLLLVILIFLMMEVAKLAPTAFELADPSTPVFQEGFLRGYEPMDLLAAFFFSAFVFKEIEKHTEHLGCKKRFLYASLTSFLGVLLLAGVYGVFVYMGAVFASTLHHVSPELLLPTIAFEVMGEKAAFVMAIIILLSCLTTAVALSGIYAQHIQEVTSKKMTYGGALILSLGISFILSLWDFKGIMSFLSPILDILYPALIVYTMFSLSVYPLPALKKYSFMCMLVIGVCIKNLF